MPFSRTEAPLERLAGRRSVASLRPFGAVRREDHWLEARSAANSRLTHDCAVLDLGFQGAGGRRLRRAGDGHIAEHFDAIVAKLSEEHAVVDLSACGDRPDLRARVIPNHVCVVSTVFARAHLPRDSQVQDVVNSPRAAHPTERVPPISHRGRAHRSGIRNLPRSAADTQAPPDYIDHDRERRSEGNPRE